MKYREIVKIWTWNQSSLSLWAWPELRSYYSSVGGPRIAVRTKRGELHVKVFVGSGKELLLAWMSHLIAEHARSAGGKAKSSHCLQQDRILIGVVNNVRAQHQVEPVEALSLDRAYVLKIAPRKLQRARARAGVGVQRNVLQEPLQSSPRLVVAEVDVPRRVSKRDLSGTSRCAQP